MPRSRDTLRVLLLQIRREERVRREEHESFADYCGLTRSQIDVLNVFDRPGFPTSVANGYDALLIGGASEASVLEPERYPFIGSSIDLTLACADATLPVFASCFGFQLAAVGLGGELIRDERDFEMGTVPIRLTDAARSDPVMHDTPDGFLAVSVHRERTTTAPPGCETLAYTDACCHAFRISDQPFWAFQFHPEVDRSRLVERLTIFKQHYTEDDDHLSRVLANARETPEANSLPRKFIDRVLLEA